MLPCDLQMWMNVLEALIGVIPMQRATTLMGVTPVLVTMDTQGMGFPVQVSKSILSASTPLEITMTTFVAKLHVLKL